MSDGDLRERAENAAGQLGAEALAKLTPEQTAGLLHELQVHQIELEMQNDELRRTQEALETSRARYFDLYDLAPVGYFTIGEKGTILEANLTAAGALGLTGQALAGRRFAELIVTEDEDAYYLHRKALFSSGEPQSCELRLRRPDADPLWVLLEASLSRHDGGDERACRTTMTDITDRKRAEEALADSARRLHTALHETVRAMGAIMDLRDPYTTQHQRRATRLAAAIAESLGLDERRREGLRLAGSVYDLGKLGVPIEILSKPGPLSETERGVVRQHAAVGRDILAGIAFGHPVATIVGQHHERLDGSGYPDGLKGAEIVFEARILGVADVVSAMTGERPHRPALDIDTALAEVHDGAGSRYDTAVVTACEKVFAAGFALDD